MKDKNKLGNYLLSRFFITLFFIWLCQMIINFLMKVSIIPYVESLLGLEGMLTGSSISGAARLFMSSLLIIIVRSMAGSGGIIDNILESGFLKGFLGDDLVKTLLNINESLDNERLAFYALSVIVLFLLLLLIWALPYVAGAILYSRRVSIKMDELERERLQMEKEFERERNLLLSDITHDIKTPITTIAGFSKALSDGTVPKEEEENYLNAIYNKSMTVSSLISLLFEYIKMDSKGYALSKAMMDIAESLRECVASFYTEFEEKGMEIELNIPEERVMIMADKMQIERAVNNLLSNTIAHNPEGTIVKIELKDLQKNVEINISDTGVRIDKEDAIHLFDPFYRGDKSRKSGRGNGLGLSISKKIVDMHGGRLFLIQYEDIKKHGKVKSFMLCLPKASKMGGSPEKA